MKQKDTRLVIAVKLEPILHRKLKICAAEYGISLQKLGVLIFTQWIQQKGKTNEK